ncbi:hypothetical protein ACH5RR_026547 [Cinchona calisaya]|uniref:Uncharacterized protein n=1 Tax=Cinchona calisaya TaxID=153742 RepID=A0ABD2Z2W6_9GENT
MKESKGDDVTVFWIRFKCLSFICHFGEVIAIRNDKSSCNAEASKHVTDYPTKSIERNDQIGPMHEGCKLMYEENSEKSTKQCIMYEENSEKSTKQCIIPKGLEKSDSNYEEIEEMPLAEWVAEIRNRNRRDRLLSGTIGTARSMNGASGWLEISNNCSKVSTRESLFVPVLLDPNCKTPSNCTDESTKDCGDENDNVEDFSPCRVVPFLHIISRGFSLIHTLKEVELLAAVLVTKPHHPRPSGSSWLTPQDKPFGS